MSEQKRKSISVKPTTYEKLQQHIEECNKANTGDQRFTISGFVETLVASFFAKLPVKPGAGRKKRRPLKPGEPCDHPGCFSHQSKPCDDCGRIGGREPQRTNRTPSAELDHRQVKF